MTHGFIHSRRSTAARTCILFSVDAACEILDVSIQLGVTTNIRKIKGASGGESRSIRQGISGTHFLIWGKGGTGGGELPGMGRGTVIQRDRKGGRINNTKYVCKSHRELHYFKHLKHITLKIYNF